MAIKYVEIVAGTSDARYPVDRTNQLAAGIYVDSNDGYKLKYIANGVVAPIQDASGVQSGVEVTTVFSLLGTLWHTGNGGANILSWPNPNAGSIIITRVLISETHASTGAATMAAGTTTASKITASDNLIDDFNLATTAPATYSNLNKTDTEVDELPLASGGWITFTASADPSGFTGNAYIFWFAV